MGKSLLIRRLVAVGVFASLHVIGFIYPQLAEAQVQRDGKANTLPSGTTPQATQALNGPEHNGVKLSELIPLLKPNTEKANSAASLVIGFGASGAPATVPLARLLKEDHNPDVRRHAAVALWSIGSKAKAATLVLRNAIVKDDNPSVRVWAARALARTASHYIPESVDALLKIFRTETGTFDCRNAVDGLGEIGPKAGKAIPELEKAASDADADVAQAARDALQKIKQSGS